MKNVFKMLVLVCVATVMMYGCAGSTGTAIQDNAASARHPELTEQEKLVSCASCHKDITPEIYRQWYDSRHGLDKVKCFLCHGTYENFRAVPDDSSCASCHNVQVEHSAGGKRCWDCHPAHNFKGHI